MTKEQEVFEKVNRIRIDFFDSKYKDVHTDDELEEKYEALGDVLNMLKEKDKEINRQNGIINALQCELKERTEERDRKDDIVTKQNKIIDLMAEGIEWLCKNFGILLDEEHDENFTQEDIKQCFESQVLNK